jgi:hypothetical protein
MFFRSHARAVAVRDQIQVSFHVPAASERRARIERRGGIRVVACAGADEEKE